MVRDHKFIAMLAAVAAVLSLCSCEVPNEPAHYVGEESATSATGGSDVNGNVEEPQSSSGGQNTASGAADSGAADSGASGGTLASAALEALPVKGRAPKTGYSRDQFGDAWSDVDHNGCDTRNDILKRDLTDVTFKDGTHDCVVLTGVLNDPYTGTVINFQRGQDTSTAVQIDHVVALSNAWQTGAQQLSADQRLQLANDPYNLLAVDGPANQQKSDGDAATWLPSNKGFRCEYVARQIGVKTKYSLWVTDSEKAAMSTVLSSCPAQTVPETDGVSGGASIGGGTSAAASETEPEQTAEATEEPAPAETTTGSDDSGDVVYPNCAAAREAGAAPLHEGDPGYSTKLDRDGDGVACE